MHTLQRMLDGTWSPAVKYTSKQLIAVSDDEMVSRDRVKVAWLNAPPVQAFLKNACMISDLDRMTQAYIDHLDGMPSFETMARAARSADDASQATPTQRQAAEPPTWYETYLRSDHWKRIRQSASRYYGGCVLCGDANNQECHHRHYLSLGRECVSTDVSILCQNHHKIVRGYLGIRVPRNCPDNVEVLLRRWGLSKT